jgi:hypothetical protein
LTAVNRIVIERSALRPVALDPHQAQPGVQVNNARQRRAARARAPIVRGRTQ